MSKLLIRALSFSLQLVMQLEYYNIISNIVGEYLAILFLLLNMLIVLSLTPEIFYGAVSVDSYVFERIINLINQGIIDLAPELIWIALTVWFITVKVQALSMVI
ncbi:MAG: hypothetical protein ACP6IP_10175 [Candidatus Njordarchaeia archaeon]